MAKGSAFVGWTLGTAGLIGIYAAYKNQSPIDIVSNVLTGETTTPDSIFLARIRSAVSGVNLSPQSTGVGLGVLTNSGADFNSAPDPTGYGTDVRSSGLVVSPRAQKIQARQMSPTLVPLPWQPNMMMDYEAAKALVLASVEFGSPIWATGTLRSSAAQASGNAKDPGRFAEAGTSAHEVGLAIDVDANKINVSDPRFTNIMHKHGYFNVGRSGPMHFSYGVPA